MSLRGRRAVSELERILSEVVGHAPGQGQAVHVDCQTVDDQAAQVLQAAGATSAHKRLHEFEVHSSGRWRRQRWIIWSILFRGRQCRGRCRVRAVTPGVCSAGGHIMLYETDHIREGQDAWPGEAVGIQAEAGVRVLDAHIGGATRGFDRQCE